MSAPLPPADLATRRPLTLRLNTGAQFSRFYTRGPKRGPIYFDRTDLGRFNAPAGTFGVCYCAATPEGAFAESFLRSPGRRLLPGDLVATKAYGLIKTTAPLLLVQLTGASLARLGATAEITHGGLPYDAPQAWSAALYGLEESFDGIAYTARHDDHELCFALYDRAETKLQEVRRVTNLSQGWFYDLMERYDAGLAPD